MIIEGKVWIFGDNIDTDAIIAARYLSTFEPQELASHLMEDIRPEFPGIVKKGDIVVAGKNFGCGSSREHAPIALKGAGVSCVVARSFARIFYRNAINIGLPILECADPLSDLIPEGNGLRIDLNRGLITHIQSGREYSGEIFPTFMQELINAGGLVEYIKNKLNN